MFRVQLPRLYELLELIDDPASADAYFQNFETRFQTEPLYNAAMTCLEKKLGYLDVDAWNALKDEASPYLTRRDPRRGWSQLCDIILGQTDAYKYLRDIGCSKVRFIPRSDKQGQRTPDLEGLLDSRRILCEVKTINVSDREIDARRKHTASKVESQLGDAFLQKFRSTITKAKGQLEAYDPMGEAQHVVYNSICFDEWIGIYREEYFRQIHQCLKDNPIPGIEVVFRENR